MVDSPATAGARAEPQLKRPRILLAGADGRLRDRVAELLRREHEVAVVNSVAAPAARRDLAADAAVVVVDNAGLAELQLGALHARRPGLPVLALTSDTDSECSVALLDTGVDDVLAVDRADAQLCARVRALLRRRLGEQGRSRQIPLVLADLRLDFALRAAWVGSRNLKLSPSEFRILSQLCLHAGRVVPHQELSEDLWGHEVLAASDSLRVYIRHIRRKLCEAYSRVSVVSQPGIGYMVTVSGES